MFGTAIRTVTLEMPRDVRGEQRMNDGDILN